MLAWSMVRGDIMRTIDGAYHFSPTTDGGTEVRYDLIIDLVVPVARLRQAPRRGAHPQHRARAEGPRRVVSRRRIGIDVGGTKCLGVVLDDDGEVIEEQRRPTPPGTEAFVDTLAELAGALGVTDSLGIGVPGHGHPRPGVIKASPNLIDITDFEVGQDAVRAARVPRRGRQRRDVRGRRRVAGRRRPVAPPTW